MQDLRDVHAQHDDDDDDGPREPSTKKLFCCCCCILFKKKRNPSKSQSLSLYIALPHRITPPAIATSTIGSASIL
jgi:hypothetical protein